MHRAHQLCETRFSCKRRRIDRMDCRQNDRRFVRAVCALKLVERAGFISEPNRYQRGTIIRRTAVARTNDAR